MMYLPGIHSAHRMYRLMFFTNFGSFSSLFLQMFFLRPSVSSLLLRLHHFCVGALDGMHLYSFSFIFYFLPLRLRNLNWTVFMFSGYSDSSYLLLSPSSELFISVIVLFNSRISILFFFIILVSLLIVSTCCNISSYPFYSLIMVLFSLWTYL